MRRLWWLPMCLLLATSARAQTNDPIGPFVVDVRGLMAGLPTVGGWTPPDLPDGTEVPSRGYGLEIGGHVFVRRLGPARLGFGAALGVGRGTSVPVVADAPEVVVRVVTLAPQLSLNFGHRLGWSYLSAGYGGVRVDSESSATSTVPGAVAESGWVGSVNLGGGARWFITDHIGIGFDARWHRVSTRDATATQPVAPRVALFHLAVGISVQ